MKSIKWWALVGMTSMAMACGGVNDDAQLKDLEDDEVDELCTEVCADAEPYELMCGEGDNQITYSSDADVAGCEPACAMYKNVSDSCTATAGDVRATAGKPASCDEGAEQLAAGLKLVSCF